MLLEDRPVRAITVRRVSRASGTLTVSSGCSGMRYSRFGLSFMSIHHHPTPLHRPVVSIALLHPHPDPRELEFVVIPGLHHGAHLLDQLHRVKRTKLQG